MTAPLHQGHHLTLEVDGKTRTVYVLPDLLQEVRDGDGIVRCGEEHGAEVVGAALRYRHGEDEAFDVAAAAKIQIRLNSS